MSKRIATSELNHDNWDAQEEPEERGTFKKASPDVIERRVIKSAKRRSTGITDSSEVKKSPFAGLGSFKLPSASSSPFSFLNHVKDNNIPSPGLKKNDANSVTESALKTDTVGSSIRTTSDTASTKTKDADLNNGEKSADYYSKLKGLNESVSDWIRLHVNKNPFCILTPIFKDYEQYLQDIEKSKKSSSDALTKDSKSTLSKDWKTGTSGATSSSLFGKINENEKSNNLGLANEAADKAPKFTFGSTVNDKEGPSQFSSIFGKAHSRTDAEVSPKKPTDSPNLGVGKESNPLMVNPFITSNTKPSFFGASTSTPVSVGFTFGSGISTLASGTTANKDDEDYQPPKPTFTPVQEEGAAYSKRCKVFVRKDSSYQERGVGTLFLKPLEEKTQLIVRADTSLGNVLMNCLLSSTMSPQKMGSNNVMLVCLPTPESKPPPVPVLLKVKTSEDADELLAKLKDFIDKRK